ncbi:hypothetical protein [Pseudomonas sp. RIT288]|uniref:hypothetical protein n=1 Tax=Pseudomonas sp. RIT288 TaxID=1470589 RepID=UPI001362B3E2|nr:hypothetical protein [Pseudomonas sp. RIT288]
MQHLRYLTHRFREQARSHRTVVFQGIDPLCASIHANNAINILLQLRDHPPQ